MHAPPFRSTCVLRPRADRSLRDPRRCPGGLIARHGQRLPNVFLGGRVTVPPRRRRTRPFPAPLRGVCRHRARRVPRPKRKLTSAARAATSPVMGGIYRTLVFALAMLAALSVARAEPARLPIQIGRAHVRTPVPNANPG